MARVKKRPFKVEGSSQKDLRDYIKAKRLLESPIIETVPTGYVLIDASSVANPGLKTGRQGRQVRKNPSTKLTSRPRPPLPPAPVRVTATVTLSYTANLGANAHLNSIARNLRDLVDLVRICAPNQSESQTVEVVVLAQSVNYRNPLEIVFLIGGISAVVIATVNRVLKLYNNFQASRLKKAETDAKVEAYKLLTEELQIKKTALTNQRARGAGRALVSAEAFKVLDSVRSDDVSAKVNQPS